MQRREFIAGIAIASLWGMPSARAQQPRTGRLIGVLYGGSIADPQGRAGLASFAKELQALGWSPGTNLAVEYRFADGNPDKMRRLAREMVEMRPEVIVGHTTPVVEALQKENPSTPIVFVVVSDPIGTGFVKSLARPGGNITGFTNFEDSLATKWIELLSEVAPRIKRAALLFNPDTVPHSSYFWRPFEAAARLLGIAPQEMRVLNIAEAEQSIAALAGTSSAGLVIMPDIVWATKANLDAIIALAARHRLPTIYPYRYMVAQGGLISYGVDTVDIWRRAPAYVDRILKGTRPGDLPVQLPTRFEMAVNLRTASAMGLNVPETFLWRADEVIE